INRRHLPPGVLAERRHSQQGAAAAPPGIAEKIARGVKADAEDPGAQVADARQLFAPSPALEESVLNGVVGVVAVAEMVGEGLQELRPGFTEGPQQPSFACRPLQSGGGHGSHETVSSGTANPKKRRVDRPLLTCTRA